MKLLEQEASKWLSMNETDSVDWLPTDIKVVETIKGNKQHKSDGLMFQMFIR